MSDVVVHPDADSLSGAVAARLLTAILEAQNARGEASVVLTGGSMGIKPLASLRDLADADAVDWSRVTLWWGDERVLPPGDTDRNEVQARAALLDHLPLDPARVHVMAPEGGDAEAAAADYERQLRDASSALVDDALTDGASLDGALFDVVMLGVGPDGHIASLFPGHPQQCAPGWVVPVHDSPKPPPTRISMTIEVLRRGRQVWFVVAGQDKADAVRNGVSGAEASVSSAAQVHGRDRTDWLVDEAAASLLER